MPRTNFGRELWDRLTAHVREHDRIDVAYECRSWTVDKLFVLSNYLAQFTQAMKGNRYFKQLVYVDLFASSGVCRVRGTDRRYPGSALLAAGCVKRFDRLILVDSDPRKLSALKQRISRLGYGGEVIFHEGDANRLARAVSSEIPVGSLTIAFVDPFSLDIEYDSIAEMAKSRPLDLIILFADNTDLLRNVETYYYPNQDSKLDAMLGKASDWRTDWDRMAVREAAQVRELFARIYRRQLQALGYVHSETFAIPQGDRPMYRLVYASKHERELKFWRIAANYAPGSPGLFGPV